MLHVENSSAGVKIIFMLNNLGDGAAEELSDRLPANE